jgi:hypothetical protein
MTHVETDLTDATHATTFFSTDAMAREVVAQNPGPADISLLRMPDWSKLSLQQLLSQPVVLQQGVQTQGDPIDIAHLSHSALLEKSAFHLDKVRGYLGLRATVVLRLVLNADKFTEGRLVLSYQPSNPYYVERRTDFRHISQLEHVDMDINSDTEVALRIPHRGPYTHFDLTNKKYNTGIFRVTEYLTHRGNPYTWTLYASFEDVDLLGPTATSTVVYEGSLEVEEKNVPLSQKVQQLSAVATSFAAVPVLTSFMAPLAWATAVGSRVLSAFGYSRPVKTLTPEVFLNRDVSKLNQTDGVDYADQLALTATTGVQVTDQIGLTMNDEMSFAHLCGINSAMLRFATATNTPVGTRIFSCPLAPFSFKARSTITSAVIMHPMAYVANVFNKYRGSISMTMDFAKTVFHSARYLVVFEPINPEGPSAPLARVDTIDKAINCHKDIIDIRKGSTFTVTFPFTSLVPYLATERPYGYVHVFVLNALVTENASVPGVVSVGVKFKAEDDMEFACPCDPRYYPYLPVDQTTQVALGTDDQAQPILPGTLKNVVYQSGLEVGDTQIIHKMIGTSTQPKPTTDMAALCIGEKILSMKQVAMRSKMTNVQRSSAVKNQDPFAVDAFYDVQWFDLGGQGMPIPQWFDFYSYVGRMYEYARGGVTITINNLEGDSLLLGTKVDGRFPTSNVPDAPYNEFALQHIVRSKRSDRVYLPQYTNSYVRYSLPSKTTLRDINPGATDTTDIYWDSGISQTSFTVYNITTGSNATNYTTWRSAADDTQFGGFKGVPYVILREPYNGEVDFKAESFFFTNS